VVPLKPDMLSLSFALEVPEVTEVTATPMPSKSFSAAWGELVLVFDQPLPVEQEIKITAKYQGEMDCSTQFMLPTCRLEGGIWYITHSQFLPMNGDYSDKFIGTMRIFISGKDYQARNVGGTGVFTGSIPHPGVGMNEFVFEHEYPTSLYAFSAGKFERVESEWSGIPLSLVLVQDQVKNSGALLGIAESVLSFYTDIYSPFPWGKLDMVEMPDSFSGGFGPPSTLMMAKFAFEAHPESDSYWSSMLLIAHETGHQWWGNLVDMADVSSVVISEGLAEFSSNLHFEKTTGSRYGFLQDSLSYMYTVPHDSEPFLISPFVASSQYYFQVVYYKGSQIFDMLRLELGEEVLLAALAEVVAQFGMQYATVEDLFYVIEQVSGVELDWFYSQWIEGKGYFRATLDGLYEDQSGTFHVAVSQDPEKFFKFTLPLQFEHADGTTTTVKVFVEEVKQEFEVPVEKPVVKVRPDPNRIQMRRFIPAVPGDLDLSGVVDGEDLVEMSFAYQMNVIMGPEWGSWFVANGRYDDLADLAGEEGPGDVDGRVDSEDLDVLMDAMK